MFWLKYIFNKYCKRSWIIQCILSLAITFLRNQLFFGLDFYLNPYLLVYILHPPHLVCNNYWLMILTMQTIFLYLSFFSANSSKRNHVNEEDQGLDFILLSIFSPLAVLVLLIVVMCLVYKHLQRRQLRKDRYPNLGYSRHSSAGKLLECWSCQSESDLHPLAQRTSAQDLDLITMIGNGKFAKIWRGLWHGDDVAVKLFHPSTVDLFNNEVSINNVVGNHQNILRLQHSHSAFSWNQISYSCIVTEYHDNGSLFDFINRRTVNIQEMFSLALSAARGLSHLHGEIYQKDETFSIAHCDIKSKNILVKANVTCAIGGLGFAVVDKWKEEISLKKKHRGTPRYMAPEILDDTVFKSFESYKRADMYSFGLVLWEIVRRTSIEGT